MLGISCRGRQIDHLRGAVSGLIVLVIDADGLALVGIVLVLGALLLGALRIVLFLGALFLGSLGVVLFLGALLYLGVILFFLGTLLIRFLVVGFLADGAAVGSRLAPGDGEAEQKQPQQQRDEEANSYKQTPLLGGRSGHGPALATVEKGNVPVTLPCRSVRVQGFVWRRTASTIALAPVLLAIMLAWRHSVAECSTRVS